MAKSIANAENIAVKTGPAYFTPPPKMDMTSGSKMSTGNTIRDKNMERMCKK